MSYKAAGKTSHLTMQLTAGKGYLKFAEFRVDRANHELKKLMKKIEFLKLQ